MGYLDFKIDKDHLRKIKKTLKRRGLRLDENEPWEIHGPHMDMNYVVYIGRAYKGSEFFGWVAVYPRAVYAIGVPENWWKASPEDKLPVNK